MAQYTDWSKFQNAPGTLGLALCNQHELFNWQWGNTVVDESFLVTSKPQKVPLWRKPSAVSRVCHYASGQAANGPAYVNGMDYVWNAGDDFITIPAGSALPQAPVGFLTTVDPLDQYAAQMKTHAGTDLKIGVDFIDYTAHIKYTAASPIVAPEVNPFGVLAGAIGGSYPYAITFWGDSILQNGGITSQSLGKAPFLPGVVDMYCSMLSSGSTAGSIRWRNLAHSGWDAYTGMVNVQQVNDTQSDGFVLAYGMNDASGNISKENFKTYVRNNALLFYGNNPAAEVTLVAGMTSNPVWVNSWPKFHGYRDVLHELCGEFKAQGRVCRVVDVMSTFEDMLKHKAFADLTSNGVNHPNDFFAKTYAQCLAWAQLGAQP